jgi:hypothetical protein
MTGEVASWRPSKRAKVAALVLAVLLVVGVTGGIVVFNHNVDAPVDAVRAYVDAIARGDATTANRLADPKRFGDGVDPKLLTDEVLRSAKERISVKEVHLDDGNASSDVVAVRVEYSLGTNQGATVLLRAKRSGTTAGVFHEWQILDPLLVPVRVETNEPQLETASLGAATVPVSGSDYGGFPEHRFFVYPGVYDLRGHESRYLSADADPLVATSHGYGYRPADDENQLARAVLWYRATTELTDTVRTKLAGHVTACVAAMPKVPRNCPEELSTYADFATGVRLARQPVIESISSYQVEYHADGTTEPSLRMIARDGRFSFDYHGERDNEEFMVYARLLVTPADDLTVTFTEAL